MAGQGSWPRSPAKKGTLPRINPAVDSYTAAGRLQDLLAPHSDQTQVHHLGPEAPESAV
ncbi:hypothetical protein ACFY8K_19495 [Streptomyces misionensis]|uniref:hypothetical protein n=1 Tax=Streptomyces misionensis TaxID=67331 RepID=UPI00367963FD